MKSKKWIILTVQCLLLAAGLVFLGLSIFSDVPGSRYLPIALGCIGFDSLLTAAMQWRRNKQ